MGCCSHGHSHGKGHHHHHHHHDSSCCHEEHSCCCCADEVCESEEHDECCKGEKLLEIADLAWMEVLKEKIKEHILANDTKLNELAKLVAEANHKRWMHKIDKKKCCAEAEQCCSDYQDQLCKLFSSCGSESCQTGQKK